MKPPPELAMRMSHYFLSLAVLCVGGLSVTVGAGLLRQPWHLSVALPTALAVVALHSLVILFVLIGTRLLREGIQNCGLDPAYLGRANAYFKRLSGLFLSLGGAFSIVAAAVLGYGERAFQLPSWVHLSVGLLAALLTVVSLPLGWRTLRGMERLLDESVETLRAEDRRRAAAGLGPVDEGHLPQRDSQAQVGLFIALAPWCVYLYQALIVWQGRFGEVSLHPWLEISAVGLVIWWLGRRKKQVEGSEA